MHGLEISAVAHNATSVHSGSLSGSRWLILGVLCRKWFILLKRPLNSNIRLLKSSLLPLPCVKGNSKHVNASCRCRSVNYLKQHNLFLTTSTESLNCQHVYVFIQCLPVQRKLHITSYGETLDAVYCWWRKEVWLFALHVAEAGPQRSSGATRTPRATGEGWHRCKLDRIHQGFVVVFLN